MHTKMHITPEYTVKKDFFSGIILRHAAVNYYLAVFFCQVVQFLMETTIHDHK